VLAPERRHSVLTRARERDARIVEDDYDAEFRYDREPVGTLQSLAPDRVVLLGTVSKSLALASLLESGRYDRHLRRMRKAYAARRSALVPARSRAGDRHARSSTPGRKCLPAWRNR
jgi:GntR family transcriptional regulator/MocR family aminotransferase